MYLKVPLQDICLYVKQIQCFWNAKLALQKYAHDTFLLTLFTNCISGIPFYCELVYCELVYFSVVITYITYRTRIRDIAMCADNRTKSSIIFLVCQHRALSKTLLLNEWLSFLKGYQNGSSINADPGGFRDNLFISCDS